MRLFGKKKKKTPVEQYLAHLDSIFQVEPIFSRTDSKIEGLPGVSGIGYENHPESGMSTALTYGLSLAQHPDWKLGRPELVLSVESLEPAWRLIPAFLANELRGKHSFTYGSIIDFGDTIAPDSEMDAFLVFAPAVLTPGQYLDIDLGTGYKIAISGLYPIYSTEIPLINAMGLEKFWKHPDFDLFNVQRKRML